MEAKIYFVEPDKNQHERTDLLGLSLYNEPESPHLRIYAPQNLALEYHALPDDQARVGWLAKRFKQQMESGDESSADAYGVMLLYGLGVEQDLPAAREIFRKSVQRGKYTEAIFYSDLRLKDSDQPEAAREVAAMLLPILEAGEYHGRAVANGSVVAFSAIPELEKSSFPEDRELAERLALASESALQKGVASMPESADERKILYALSWKMGMRLYEKERAKVVKSLWTESPDKGVLERAVKLMEGGITLEPGNAKDHFFLCELLKMKGVEPAEIYDRTTHALKVSRHKPGLMHSVAVVMLRIYQWEAAARSQKLGALKAKDSSQQSDSGQPVFSKIPLYLASAGILLLALLAWWTRCITKKPAGTISVSLWISVALTPVTLIFAPVWVGLLVVPIALGLVIWAITGARVPLGYLVAPKKGNLAGAKLWAEILVVCGILFLITVVIDEIYLWAFREISGRQPENFVVGMLLDYMRQHQGWGLLGGVAIGGILVGFMEEIAFRGLLFDWVKRFAPVWLTVVLTSAGFGLLHGWDAAIPTGIMGVMFAWLRVRYESLWPPIILHVANNSILFLVLYYKPEILGLS